MFRIQGFSIQGEFDRIMGEYGGRTAMVYGGAVNGGTSGGGVTVIHSDGSVSTDRSGGHTTTVTTHSDGSETTEIRNPDGSWRSLTTLPDNGGTIYVLFDSVSGETLKSIETNEGRLTYTRNAQGILLSSNITRPDGTSESFRREGDGAWTLIDKQIGSTRIINCDSEGVKTIKTESDGGLTEIKRFNELGDLVYQSNYDDGTGVFNSVEQSETGQRIEIKRTGTTTENWFGSGSVTEIEEIKTITTPGNGVQTLRSVTRVETDFASEAENQPGVIDRAGGWLTDTIKDAWERLADDNSGAAPKTGSTRVDSGTDKFTLAILAGTSSDDHLSGTGVVSGGKGRDILAGNDGADILLGGEGNDTLIGGAGADHLDGGKGFDFASYASARSGITASLLNSSQNTGEAAGDIFSGIEGFIGSAFNDNLSGDDSDNIIRAGAGADTLYGGDGTDSIYGDDGNDVIWGGSGADTANGGDGLDVLYGEAGNDAIFGGAGGDTLYGGDGADSVYGGDGADVLDGGDGDDYLFGGAGADTLNGGAGGFDLAMYDGASAGVVASLVSGGTAGDAAGDRYSGIEGLSGTHHADRLTGDENNNWLFGRMGDDTLVGGGGTDVLDADIGNDVAYGGMGDDLAYGGDGQDALFGEDGNDRLDGGNGHDSLYGGTGADALFGRYGNDILDGGAGDDHLDAGEDDDVLYGGGGNDYLLGWTGNDVLNGGAGADTLDGSDGWDFVSYDDATSGVTLDRLYGWNNRGDAAGDVLIGIESVIGSGYGDTLAGQGGYDEFWARGGNDILEGRGGGDYLNGGDGYDFAVYWSAGSGVRASLEKPSVNTGDAAGDIYVSIEGLGGSGHGDMLQGNASGNDLYGYGGNDELLGGGGGDYLNGGAGFDTLVGGEGSDWLEGGANRDVFRFDWALGAGNVDRIVDFTVAEDRIELETHVFRAFPDVMIYETDAGLTYYNSVLKSTAFTIGTAATSSAHRIVYNSATGALSYDADGSGAGAQVQFAQLSAGLALTASNFGLYTI